MLWSHVSPARPLPLRGGLPRPRLLVRPSVPNQPGPLNRLGGGHGPRGPCPAGSAIGSPGSSERASRVEFSIGGAVCRLLSATCSRGAVRGAREPNSHVLNRRRVHRTGTPRRAGRSFSARKLNYRGPQRHQSCARTAVRAESDHAFDELRSHLCLVIVDNTSTMPDNGQHVKTM